MSLLKAVVFILSVVLTFEVLFVGGMAVNDINYIEPQQEVQAPSQEEPDHVQVLSPEPAEIPYPRPSSTPSLTPYNINKNHDIWHPQDPSIYITPDNEWVKHYASLLYIDYDGMIRYKNNQIPLVVDTKGNTISWTDKPFLNNYITDNEQFDFPPDADVWVMPEYYLANGMQDDCDGWMAAVTSIMLSGEISVLENGSFIKKTIPAKAVLGYMGGNRDGWTEYRVYGKTFLTTTALVNSGIDRTEQISTTQFMEKKLKTTASPVFEFNNKQFDKYNTW